MGPGKKGDHNHNINTLAKMVSCIPFLLFFCYAESDNLFISITLFGEKCVYVVLTENWIRPNFISDGEEENIYIYIYIKRLPLFISILGCFVKHQMTSHKAPRMLWVTWVKALFIPLGCFQFKSKSITGIFHHLSPIRLG